MKDFFLDLFEYHHHFNQKLAAEIQQHLEALPERTFPLFCHVLNAHRIWNARILDLPATGVFQTYPVSECPGIDLKNLQDTLQILEQKDLSEAVTYTNTRGESFHNQVGEILFHVANHSTHHKGQIMSDFRSVGIPPLVTDYIFYKRLS